MQEATVDFKLDVSDESIKRNAMKVIWMFSGVTFVDIKEKGQVKVRGNFDISAMGMLLYEIDKSVDIINPLQKPEQNYIPIISSISSYFNVPKFEEMVAYELKLFNEHIKPAAMEVIWEFSGVTSVEVEENRRVKVKGGEINKLDMLTNLQKIDESVKMLTFGQEKVDTTKQNKFHMLGNKQSDASSSVKAPTPAAPMYGAAGARARAAAEKEKAQRPAVNKWPIDKAIEILKVPLKAGFRLLNNPLPPIKQLEVQIAKQKAEKLRKEQENANKQRIEQEKAEKQRKEEEKAKKQRKEEEKAKKLRKEKEQAEKQRKEKEQAEKQRKEKEQANTRSSTYTEGNNNTQTQTESWLTGSTSRASGYLSTVWNTSKSKESSSTSNPYHSKATGSRQYRS